VVLYITVIHVSNQTCQGDIKLLRKTSKSRKEGRTNCTRNVKEHTKSNPSEFMMMMMMMM